jgi:uncharacterized membrane protein YbhN (UPF0104 family)
MQPESPSMSRRFLSLLYWILAVSMAAGLLYWSGRGIRWGEIWRTVQSARLRYLWGAAVMMAATLSLRALRWRILLNAKARLGLGEVFQANMVGYLGNNFLPARAGEVLRSVLISRTSELTNAYVLTTALSERMMDVIAVILAGALALLGVNPKPRWLADLSGGMLAAAAAGALAVAILPHAEALVETVLCRTPMPERLREFLLSTSAQVLVGLRAFHDWGRLAEFAALTAVIWAMEGVTVMIGARALDLTIPYAGAMLLIAAMALGSALPSTPGYIGIYQFAAVMVLTPFGIPRDKALAYSVLAQGVGYAMVTALGLPALYGSRLQLRKTRSDSPAVAVQREEA